MAPSPQRHHSVPWGNRARPVCPGLAFASLRRPGFTRACPARAARVAGNPSRLLLYRLECLLRAPRHARGGPRPGLVPAPSHAWAGAGFLAPVPLRGPGVARWGGYCMPRSPPWRCLGARPLGGFAPACLCAPGLPRPSARRSFIRTPPPAGGVGGARPGPGGGRAHARGLAVGGLLRLAFSRAYGLRGPFGASVSARSAFRRGPGGHGPRGPAGGPSAPRPLRGVVARPAPVRGCPSAGSAPFPWAPALEASTAAGGRGCGPCWPAPRVFGLSPAAGFFRACGRGAFRACGRGRGLWSVLRPGSRMRPKWAHTVAPGPLCALWAYARLGPGPRRARGLVRRSAASPRPPAPRLALLQKCRFLPNRAGAAGRALRGLRAVLRV